MNRIFACCVTASIASVAAAQITVNPNFGGCYAIRELGAVSGVPFAYGGITFKHDDPDVLLIGGSIDNSNGAIYAVRVTRDEEGAINGFDGAAEVFASAENIDGGLTYGPNNVLFFSRFPSHSIGQIRPGWTSPDKYTDMSTVLPASLRTLQFVPPGFPGAGRFKVASWSSSDWCDVSITPDGTGLFNIASSPNTTINVGGGPEGIVYVQPGNPGFTIHSVLIGEFNNNSIVAFDLDAIGDPVVATRRVLISGLSGAYGGTRDPRTGHFMFSAISTVILVTGFNTTCRPNINADCYTDDADFSLFAPMYNILDCADPAMPAACPADFNDDGFVDDEDFVIFVDAYNRLICI
jgi:hypothetical protein